MASAQQTQTNVFRIEEAHKEAFLHMDVSPVLRTSSKIPTSVSHYILKHCITHSMWA